MDGVQEGSARSSLSLLLVDTPSSPSIEPSHNDNASSPSPPSFSSGRTDSSESSGGGTAGESLIFPRPAAARMKRIAGGNGLSAADHARSSALLRGSLAGDNRKSDYGRRSSAEMLSAA